MELNHVPVSGIIPTNSRSEILKRTLLSVGLQSCLPTELIIVDASTNNHTKDLCKEIENCFPFKIIYIKAKTLGAAPQRMEGIDLASQPIVWFLDDDIVLESDCTQRLWNGFLVMPNVGAVNAMITNQRYTTPGLVTRFMFRLMHGEKLPSYAGKLIGPAWNLLPEDNETLPEWVECEWLNTTCTMYKRSALPTPVFSDNFFGYSLMEDVALSAIIARKHTLVNARTARIFHDSQPGEHKNKLIDLSRMELVNRQYVMTQVLYRTNFKSYSKLFVFELFGILSTFRSWRGLKSVPEILWGKLLAIVQLLSGSSTSAKH
jgi:glycosyltransferase involved in cell wall biosynthesis